MITEEQARALLRVEPDGCLDGRAVLAAARRARRRRHAAATAAVSCAAVAAVAVASTGTPARIQPAPAPATTPAAPRLDPAQVGNAVPLTTYTEGGQRREAVAYFVQRGTELALCTASLGGPEPVRHGCASPVRPGPTHVGMVSRDPGSVGPGMPGPSSFGRNLWYAVVGTEVAGGWFVDLNGTRHDGTLLGAGDPTLPARILVADLRGNVFRAIHLVDADRRPLTDDASRAVRADVIAIGTPVKVGGYTDGRVRRDVYAYFARTSGPTALCFGAVGPDDVVDYGCNGPALPGTGGSPDVGALGTAPGGRDDGTAFGPLGRGWTLTVVSARVARGVVVDDRGGRHEGTLVGGDDPALPARFLVAELGDRWFRGVELYDAAGRRLPT